MVVEGGVPDQPGVRAAVWKLVMGYLPADRGACDAELERRRREYAEFCDDLITRPNATGGGDGGGDEDGALAARPAADDPLASGPRSEWSAFFADEEVGS